MKSTELRIGNWMLSSTEGEIQIENGWQIDEGEELNPLPLTEEWLVRFGFFVDSEIGGFVYDSDKGVSLNLSEDETMYYMGNIEPYWVDVLAQIKYVHQLQNLYFALTGQELELKP